MSTVMVIRCGFAISSSLCQKQKTAIGRVRPRSTVASFMGRHQQRARPSVKRWVTYGRDLDFTPYLKERVTEHAAGKAPDIVVLDADVSAVEQKNYDLMGDLLEADILMLFRQVLREEEALVKVGGQAQFGYLPRMALANIGAMNAESFCERILSCASLVVTDLHTSLDHDEVGMLTMLRMNKSLMEYMRKEYDNLHSHIEASETRITKQLRDKAEVQAQEAAAMDEEY